MADTKDPPTAAGVPPLPEMDLRDPRLATFLAWLVPGFGHLYQGRTGKGLLFMICILGTFAYGLHIGGGRVVYASTVNPVGQFSKFRERWVYACQLGIGLPVLPALIQTWRVEHGKEPLLGDNFLRPPYTRSDAETLFGESMTQAERDKRFFSTKDQDDNLVYHKSEYQKWHHDLAFRYELGTAYTLMAGLLNVLAICDARWGPFVAPPTKETGDKPDDSK